MAEDDDEETFGDFSFVPFPSNPQSNGRNSLDNDDEWGDFVKSPQQSKPADPSFKGDHVSNNSALHIQWVKTNGALPLSIFGEAEEEEEEEEDGDSNQGRTAASTGRLDSISSVNGVSNSMSFNIADLYYPPSQIKSENGPDSISAGRVGSDPVENGFHPRSNLNLGKSGFNESKRVDFDVTVGITGSSQLTKSTGNDEFSCMSTALDTSQSENLFGGWTVEFNGYSSNLSEVNQNVKTVILGMDMNGHNPDSHDATATNVDDGGGDGGWEFKDAYSEAGAGDLNTKVDIMPQEAFERSAYSSGGVSGSSQLISLFGSSNGSIDLFMTSTESVDLFATSSGPSGSSQDEDFFTIQESTANLNGYISDKHSNNEQNVVNGTLTSSPDVGNTDYDEDFVEFTAASAESGSKPGEVSNDDALSPPKETVSTSIVKNQDTKSNDHRGLLPLSIFGDEEPERYVSSDVQDASIHQGTSDQTNSHTLTSVISIDDLISSLYLQAEQTSSVHSVQNQTIVGSNPNQLPDSSVTSDDDYLDDSSWDFKDAFSKTRVNNETFLYSVGPGISSKLKLHNPLDFYCKLKEKLHFVAKCHIENLKQAQNNTAYSGGDSVAASVDSELQLVCKELEQRNFHSEEHNSEDHRSGDCSLKEFVEALSEPPFQRIESEYRLTEKLLLVEKDPRSAIELVRHTTTTFKILTLGTLEEQSTYISIWSDMISVCLQELKHGALIWRQAVEKGIQSQFLSEPQGRKFVLGLGEIYRVIVVLGASAKLFKPWTLLCCVHSSSIFMLLEECHAVWSTSGLEHALSNVLAATVLDDGSLLKSIKHIHDLDIHALQNSVFIEKEPVCRLSMLTAGAAPGMKVIVWEEDQCFVALANLWANLISRDPPKLPRLHIK